MTVNVLESMEAPLVYRSDAGAAQPDPERPLGGEWSRILEWHDLHVEVKGTHGVDELPGMSPIARIHRPHVDVVVEFELAHKVRAPDTYERGLQAYIAELEAEIGLWLKEGYQMDPVKRPEIEETEADRRWNSFKQELGSLFQQAKAGGLVSLVVRGQVGQKDHQVYLPRMVMEHVEHNTKRAGQVATCLVSGVFRRVYALSGEQPAVISYGR